MANITLYQFPQTVVVQMTGFNAPATNIALTDTDFKVYQGVDTPIDFTVRDDDRRPVNLTDSTVTILVHDYNTGEFLLQKDAEIIDAICGKIRVWFLAAETADWSLDYKRYSLIVDQDEGTGGLLYMDLDFNAVGFFEFIGGVVPQPQDTCVVDGTLDANGNPICGWIATGNFPEELITSAFPGDAVKCMNDGLHTVAVYTDNYTGKFYVQGSLLETPTTDDADWFYIWLTQAHPELILDESTGIEPFNFTGSIRWVRFKQMPDSGNEGAINKVAYRN